MGLNALKGEGLGSILAFSAAFAGKMSHVIFENVNRKCERQRGQQNGSVKKLLRSPSTNGEGCSLLVG